MSRKCKCSKGSMDENIEVKRKNLHLLDIKEYALVNLVNKILLMMIKSGAKSAQFIKCGDTFKAVGIHEFVIPEIFFVFSDGAHIKIDAVEADLRNVFFPIVSRLKLLAGLNVRNNNSIQRGVLKFKRPGKEYHFLVSIFPSFIVGESAIIDFIEPPKKKKCKRCKTDPCHC